MKNAYHGSGSVTGKETARMDLTSLLPVPAVIAELEHTNVTTEIAPPLQLFVMELMTVPMALTRSTVSCLAQTWSLNVDLMDAVF